MTQTLTSELIAGSKAGDQLKRDIEMMAGMLISHTDAPDWDMLEDGRENDESLKFPIHNMDAYWEVMPTYSSNEVDGYHLHIIFWFKGQEGYHRRDNKARMDMGLITEIHSSLPYLTDGMTASIPGLLKRLEYLKRAAAYVKELEENPQ